MSNGLEEAKQRLLDKLGPSYSIYIQLLGRWFRGLISKEEFDKNAKHLIKQNFVLEHNKFWLAFFHHCANNATNSLQSHNFQLNDSNGVNHQEFCNLRHNLGSTSIQANPLFNDLPKVRCLPNKVITHMKIFVIAWESGLKSANDDVSLYINLALQHFLKNIITEVICSKTAYRLRENRFKYAIGVKPMNPYLNNSLKVYTSNLEYDPYQIESNKMNSSLLDTCIYNDTLFPSRLYEAQALYEYACSTTSVSQPAAKRTKRLKLSEIFLNQDEDYSDLDGSLNDPQLNLSFDVKPSCTASEDATDTEKAKDLVAIEKRVTLQHLLVAFLTNRTIIPSQSLYSINLERIFTKLSC